MSFYRIALCVVVVFAAVIAICELSLADKQREVQENRGGFVWKSGALFEVRVILDLPPDKESYGRGWHEGGKVFVNYHYHCPEELNGGGYRDGKYVYLKELAK